jgi:hypothetical protein
MRALLIFAILSITSWDTAYGSAVSDLAATMQPRTWAKLSSKINAPGVVVKSNGGNIFEYSNRAAWDPHHKRLYFCGSSHHGTFFNDCAQYDTETDTWSSIGVPPGFCQDQCPSDAMNFMHGYDHNTFDTKRGVFYMRTGQFLYQYNTLNSTWSQSSPMPDSCYSTGVAEVLEYFPDIDRVVFLSPWCQGSGAAYYDPSTDSWTLPQIPIPNGGYHLQGAYSKDGYIYGGGGNYSSGMIRVDKHGVSEAMADCPVTCADVYSLFVGDPASGHPLLLQIDGTIYDLDPQSKTWTNTAITSNIYLEGGYGGAVVTPVSNDGVVMVAKMIYGQILEVWLYKHAPFDGPPPLPPPEPPPPPPPPVVDTTPPTVTLVSPANGATISR